MISDIIQRDNGRVRGNFSLAGPGSDRGRRGNVVRLNHLVTRHHR